MAKLDVSDLSAAERGQLLEVLEQRALMFRYNGELLVGSRAEVWHMRTLDGTGRCTVDLELRSCTCGEEGGLCKHLRVLRHGSDYSVPWRYKPRRRKIRVR